MSDIGHKELGEMIRKESSEALVARRVKEMREARGWSQSRLADELKEIRPMNQSSLSKVEAGSRGIGVDELLAFAEVFGVTVEHLLLPPEAFVHITGWEKFQDAAAALNDVRTSTTKYLNAIMSVRSVIAKSPDLVKRIESMRDAVLAREQAELDALDDQPEGGWYVGDTNTPLTLAARDALGDDKLASGGPIWWTSTRAADFSKRGGADE